MTNRESVLILCTGNSCRSQMAEGLLRDMAGDRFTVHSAGTEPSDQTHPMAVRVMSEIDIDIADQKPKSLREFLGKSHINWLIIVCDGANNSCPRVWPGLQEGRKLFWPFDDPADATGTDDEKLAVFRRVRDEIQAKLAEWTDR